MTRASHLDMTREMEKKRQELQEIEHARELIANGNLRESSVLLFNMLEKAYGKVCIRNWVFRQYNNLNKDNSPTQLGKTIGDFLDRREEERAWWS